MNSINLLENSQNLNIKLFILDPLSVIIKLAIIGNKPVGTKILIKNNVIYLQEPGPFQSLCRIYNKSNKTDLQFLYNPIQLACITFLSKESITKMPRLKELFSCAQNGIKKLMETYKNSSIISLCLNYYYIIIINHIEQKYNDTIFLKDTLTNFYSKELVDALNNQWSKEKIKVILDLIAYLTMSLTENNVKSIETIMENNVKSLETIMDNNDMNSQNIINNI